VKFKTATVKNVDSRLLVWMMFVCFDSELFCPLVSMEGIVSAVALSMSARVATNGDRPNIRFMEEFGQQPFYLEYFLAAVRLDVDNVVGRRPEN
jgi:hypothetical protein